MRVALLVYLLLWFVVVAAEPLSEPEAPVHPAPTQVQQRLTELLGTGECWNGPGTHPFAHHAFYITPTTGLHHGPSGPAFAIVFGPDGAMYSGDEAPGSVLAFCR